MNSLHFDIIIAAPPAVVWRALTGPEGVAALYFGSRLVTTFGAGTPYQYIGPDGDGGEVVHVEGEVLECRESAVLLLTHRAGARWRTGPTVHTSRLAYRLAPAGASTTLSIVQDQWMDGDPAHAHNSAGWPVFLSNVKAWVENGTAPTLA